jgi:hypothetical protein
MWKDRSDGKKRRRKQILDYLKETTGYWELMEEALSLSVENSFWKRLWTCCKADCGMNE